MTTQQRNAQRAQREAVRRLAEPRKRSAAEAGLSGQSFDGVDVGFPAYGLLDYMAIATLGLVQMQGFETEPF